MIECDYKVLKDMGTVEGHDDVQLFLLSELGMIAMTGWNGEKYTDCYRIENAKGYAIDSEVFSLYPVYKYDANCDQYDIVGFEDVR